MACRSDTWSPVTACGPQGPLSGRDEGVGCSALETQEAEWCSATEHRRRGQGLSFCTSGVVSHPLQATSVRVSGLLSHTRGASIRCEQPGALADVPVLILSFVPHGTVE